MDIRPPMTVSEMATYINPQNFLEDNDPQDIVETILSLFDYGAWKPGDPTVHPINGWVDYVLGAVARQA